MAQQVLSAAAKLRRVRDPLLALCFAGMLAAAGAPDAYHAYATSQVGEDPTEGAWPGVARVRVPWLEGGWVPSKFRAQALLGFRLCSAGSWSLPCLRRPRFLRVRVPACMHVCATSLSPVSQLLPFSCCISLTAAPLHRAPAGRGRAHQPAAAGPPRGPH